MDSCDIARDLTWYMERDFALAIYQPTIQYSQVNFRRKKKTKTMKNKIKINEIKIKMKTKKKLT